MLNELNHSNGEAICSSSPYSGVALTEVNVSIVEDVIVME